MDKIAEIIKVMYDENVPMMKLGNLKPDFKLPKTTMQTMLFTEQPKTPEDSEHMMDNSALYVEMLIAAEVLVIERPPKDAPEGTQALVVAGTNFNLFNEEVKKYTDQDAMILRALNISKQDFDGIVNEYREIMKDATNLDDILESWETLDMEVKGGIIRGVLFQRSILAEVIQHMRQRMSPVIKHQMETMQWLNTMAGPQEPPK